MASHDDARLALVRLAAHTNPAYNDASMCTMQPAGWLHWQLFVQCDTAVSPASSTSAGTRDHRLCVRLPRQDAKFLPAIADACRTPALQTTLVLTPSDHPVAVRVVVCRDVVRTYASDMPVGIDAGARVAYVRGAGVGAAAGQHHATASPVMGTWLELSDMLRRGGVLPAANPSMAAAVAGTASTWWHGVATWWDAPLMPPTFWDVFLPVLATRVLACVSSPTAPTGGRAAADAQFCLPTAAPWWPAMRLPAVPPVPPAVRAAPRTGWMPVHPIAAYAGLNAESAARVLALPTSSSASVVAHVCGLHASRPPWPLGGCARVYGLGFHAAVLHACEPQHAAAPEAAPAVHLVPPSFPSTLPAGPAVVRLLMFASQWRLLGGDALPLHTCMCTECCARAQLSVHHPHTWRRHVVDHDGVWCASGYSGVHVAVTLTPHALSCLDPKRIGKALPPFLRPDCTGTGACSRAVDRSFVVVNECWAVACAAHVHASAYARVDVSSVPTHALAHTATTPWMRSAHIV